MSRRELLSELRNAEVITWGNVILKSGAETNYYANIKKALGDPEVLSLAASVMTKELDPRTTCVAASGIGGISLATMISVETGIMLCLVRDQPKNHGIHSALEFYIPDHSDNVTIVDDVFSSGTGMRQTDGNLSSTGTRRIAGLVLLQRGEGETPFPVKAIFQHHELINGRVD